LWDVGQPNLYTLKLSTQGGGASDEMVQRFGFREFWVEGQKLFLNGKEFGCGPTWPTSCRGDLRLCRSSA
jgi:beta-galactosidase